MALFDLIAGTLAEDERVNSQSVEKADSGLTFKRDEKGVLWSYDAAGNKIGRIYEHGDSDVDTVKEI